MRLSGVGEFSGMRIAVPPRLVSWPPLRSVLPREEGWEGGEGEGRGGGGGGGGGGVV